MRKGTFSVQTANANSSKHNSRELAPKYLIDSSQKNHYELITPDDKFKNLAQEIYKEKIKQTMQKKQVDNLIQETVLTLQEHQNENDVKELFKKLNKKYGGHELLEIAIHRDEGYFLKDEIAYYPTKNILNKNGDWYVCSNNEIAKPKKEDFDKKVNIDEFEKVYNYHAHAKFSMFDRETGKTARMQKKDMSERIKFVSEHLELAYNPSADRLIKKPVNQIKDEHLAKAREKEKNQELAKQKDLNEEITKLRTELKQENAKREDYAKLEQLNRDLKERIKQKDLTIDDLKEIIDANSKEKEHLKSIIEVKEIDNIDLKNQNKSLQEQKTVLNDKLVDLEKKNDSRPNMSDLEVNKQLQKIVNDEIEEKEIKTGLFSSEKAPVIKNQKSFFEKIKDLALKGAETVAKEFLELKTKYSDLVIKFNAVTKENAELKAKVKTLESERSSSPKQQKENAMESIKNLMSETNDKKGEKSLKEFLEKKAKEKDKKSSENYRNR